MRAVCTFWASRITCSSALSPAISSVRVRPGRPSQQTQYLLIEPRRLPQALLTRLPESRRRARCVFGAISSAPLMARSSPTQRRGCARSRSATNITGLGEHDYGNFAVPGGGPPSMRGTGNLFHHTQLALLLPQTLAQKPPRSFANRHVSFNELLDYVHFSSTSSSAILGCSATVSSNWCLVRPAFTATAAVCNISGASGPIICSPTTRLVVASTTIL